MISLKSLLTEASFAGKTFISVDIQPAYENAFGFSMHQYAEFLNNLDCHKLVFLFNGPDLGFPNESEYQYWLMESGVSEEVISSALFYDKGYAFFRYCMDSGIDEDAVANFVRFMHDNNIRDSREMDRDAWAKYLRQYRRLDKTEVYELLKHASDCIHIPDLMDYLQRFNNIILTGGGMNECLKEVEIALKALKKPYQLYNQFVY